MKQGDIYLADLNPIKGSEQGGLRPIVIISGNVMNDNLGVCITCPISSKIKNYSSCVPIKKSSKNGLSCDSEIITFQIRTISNHRFQKKLGKMTNEEMQEIFKGLSLILKF